MGARKISRSGVWYVLPALVVICGVMLYPLLYTIVTGFMNNTLQMRTPTFAGLGQYRKLFSDPYFFKAVRNTVAWTAGSVSCQFLLGFVLALLLHQPFVKGKTILRILLMVPWVMPSIISSMMWKWLYNADFGIINYILRFFHIIEGYHLWLTNPRDAMLAVVVVNAWKMFPFVLLMVEAALQSVSKELKEAAIVDGANKVHVFCNVTWPSVAPACFSVLLLLIIWTLNSFTFIYAMTAGGPARATEVMSMYIYNLSMGGKFDFGAASAASMVLFVLAMGFGIFYMKVTKKNEEVGA
jgi:multiple sugar transport system permease protein